MSYDYGLVRAEVQRALYLKPHTSLEQLSQELHISCRTIQTVVGDVNAGSFRQLRDRILLKKIHDVLEARPTVAIKELSWDVGYKSPRSFARAVKRACGIRPADLRARLSQALLQ